MPRYEKTRIDGRDVVELDYSENFAALGIRFESPPVQLVPLFPSVEDAVDAMRPFAEGLERQLVAMNAFRPIKGVINSLYEWKLRFPFVFFRGESNAGYDLMPRRYRGVDATNAQDRIRDSLEDEREGVRRISEHWTRVGETWTEGQARAAARHVGRSSGFVDFTFSPQVAAFFGHPGRKPTDTAALGKLYCLKYDVIERILGVGVSGWNIEAINVGFDIHIPNTRQAWKLPSPFQTGDTLVVPAPKVEAVTIQSRRVPGLSRIVGQQGLFIEMTHQPDHWWCHRLAWTALDFISLKACYVRTDAQYEDARSGVTTENLLDEDPELLEAGEGNEAA